MTSGDPYLAAPPHTNDWEFDDILDLVYAIEDRHRVYRSLWICACGFQRRHEIRGDSTARGSVHESTARNREWAAFLRHKYGSRSTPDEPAQFEHIWDWEYPRGSWFRRVANFDWWLTVSVIITCIVFLLFMNAMAA